MSFRESVWNCDLEWICNGGGEMETMHSFFDQNTFFCHMIKQMDGGGGTSR